MEQRKLGSGLNCPRGPDGPQFGTLACCYRLPECPRPSMTSSLRERALTQIQRLILRRSALPEGPLSVARVSLSILHAQLPKDRHHRAPVRKC
jgi:hypothetical protein